MTASASNIFRAIRIALFFAIFLCMGGCRDRTSNENASSPRVVTFSPAITDMIFEMGLGDHIVGVSSYCRLPDGEERPDVGNVLNIRSEPILTVDPDLILTQIEPETLDAVRQIAPDIAIEHFEIETLEDIAVAMERIGRLLDDPEKGILHSDNFRASIQELEAQRLELDEQRVLFVTGYEQPLAAGRETFIDEMMTLAGGRNVLSDRFKGWKAVGLETILETSPDVIVCLCTDGRKDEAERYWTELGASRRVILLDDPDWTIPAGHLPDYTCQLRDLLHEND